MTKSRKLEKERTFILVTLLILFAIASIFFYIYFNRMESSPGVVPPKISYEIIVENDDYTVRITEAKEGDSPLDIEQLGVGVANDTQYIMKADLPKILDNTTSNLTFYDEDDDGKLSKGDVFVIRGNNAIEGKKLNIWSTEYGRYLKRIYFK